MKKILLKACVLTLVFFVSSCSNDELTKENVSKNNSIELQNSIKAINDEYAAKIAEKQKYAKPPKPINRKKALFMLIADGLSANAGTILGPYGTLWTGFLGSCGAASLYEDVYGIRAAEEGLDLPVNIPSYPNNDLAAFAEVGNKHNLYMVHYLNNYSANPVFVNNRPDDWFINEMIASEDFHATVDTKAFTYQNLYCLDSAFDLMHSLAPTELTTDSQRLQNESYIIAELKNNNPQSNAVKYPFFMIADFIYENGMYMSSYDVYNYISSVEQAMIYDTSIGYDDLQALLYSTEMLRYSYGLWTENIEE